MKQISRFAEIMSGLNYLYVFIEDRLFFSYEKDGIKIISSYHYINTALNIESTIFSILIFLFVIIFLSISEFTNPIKYSNIELIVLFILLLIII